MKVRRSRKMLVEPASSATGDIAFNLIVFFLVCASVQPDAGRSQQIPRADDAAKGEQKQDDVTVQVTRTTVLLNGSAVRQQDFVPQLKAKLAGKTAPEDRIVVVKSSDDTPYFHWMDVTLLIAEAGGIVTLQIEEEKEVLIHQ